MHLFKSLSLVLFSALALVSFTAQAECRNCGVVESVQTVETQGHSSGGGAIVGGLIGGLIGNQFGHGSGRTAATIAGAAGGAYAGNEMEKDSNRHLIWQVRVRMDYGEWRTFDYRQQPDFAAGDRVRVRHDELFRVRRRR